MVKVLIVDDQPELRHVLQICLRAAGLEILEAANGTKALDRVKEHAPEIIILDVMLPDMNGIEVCSRIRTETNASNAYIIMLSAKTDTSHRVAGLENGADAYLTKPFQPDEIMAQLRVGLRAVENRRSYLQDPLTGIFGRRAFDAMLEQTIARCHRHDEALSMVMIDIDRFKTINDTFGHHAGDEVLKGIAALLKTEARESDLYFRWGGEEFVWLLSDTDENGALVAAERFRSKIKNHTFPDAGAVTVSLGISTLNPNEDGMSLCKRADEALYEAKEAGRNCTRQHHVQETIAASA